MRNTGLGIEESREYDTLAGFIIFNYEGIPTAGETVFGRRSAGANPAYDAFADRLGAGPEVVRIFMA